MKAWRRIPKNGQHTQSLWWVWLRPAACSEFWNGSHWGAEGRDSSSDGVLGCFASLFSYQMGELWHFRVLGGWLQIRAALWNLSQVLFYSDQGRKYMLQQVMGKNEAGKDQGVRLKSSSGVCEINSNTSVCYRCSSRAAGAQRRIFGQSNSWMWWTDTNNSSYWISSAA